MGFVYLLKEVKILLNKSQVPTVKMKRQSIRIKFWSNNFARPNKEKNFLSWLDLKIDLKRKTDLKARGNKKIVLNSWEEEMLKLLETDGKNPEFQKIPGKKIDTRKYVPICNRLKFSAKIQ
jgi:hypothetical protein